MRFYNGHHTFYGGIDLHKRSLYLCVIDENRDILVHRPIKNSRTDLLLKALEPYREDLAIAAESSYGWYWLADFCQDNDIHFVLGHALYMRAIHGGKVKNDKIDSKKIALLLQGGLIPQGYVYPREFRPLRDLLRRRLHFVQHRADLCGHIQVLNDQCNNPPLKKVKQSKKDRPAIPDKFDNEELQKSVAMDIETINHYDKIIAKLEWHIGKKARGLFSKEISVLTGLKGVGDIIALTIVMEIGDINRFPTVGQFASYARLVRGSFTSAKKKYKSKGKKIGNPYLKRALSEAAMLASGYNPEIKKWRKKREHTYGKGKSYAILSHKLGRAFYHMIKKGTAFDMNIFLNRN
jgi:transposase